MEIIPRSSYACFTHVTARSGPCWNEPAFALANVTACRRRRRQARDGRTPHITRTSVHSAACSRVDWTTWWPWRGAYTRSHPELGREIPQRPWYCVLRHGRVGRRQVFQSTLVVPGLPRDIDVLPPGATVGIPPPPTRGGAAR